MSHQILKFAGILAFFRLFYLVQSDFLTSLPKCKTSIGLDSMHIEIPSVLMSTKVKTEFRILEQILSCKSAQHNISFPLILDEGEEVEVSFEVNGLLKYDSGHYWKNEYCLQSLSLSEIVISICEISCSDPQNTKICVPKCCPWGKVLDFVNSTYVNCRPGDNSNINWTPKVYTLKNASYCLDNRNQSPECIHNEIREEVFHYQNTFLGCEDDFIMDRVAYDDTPFAFAEDGTLQTNGYHWRPSEFCIDALYRQTSTPTQPHSHAALACICNKSDPFLEEKEVIDVTYVVVMFISTFFLLLTVIVYILIWDKQNIHGWTVFSLSISMGLMLLFLGTARLIGMTQMRESVGGSGRCVFVGLMAHFLFLSTFSLLTCLSFDLWYTFRTLTPTIGRSKGIRRFRMYLVFSLGLPFLIVLLGYILDTKYGHLPKLSRGVILPEYGKDTCYIADKMALGIYVYLPVALLLLANLLFFLTTMWIMYNYHQSTKAARKNAVNQKQTLYLFTKLFIVMGVTWTVEVIEYLSSYNRVEKDSQNCTIYQPPGYQWLVTDFFNIVQGILIFIIFVCKKSVMVHLSHRSSALKVIVSPVFLLPCCKLNQMDFEAPSGRTNQSSVSMRTFSVRNQENSSDSH